MKEKIRHSANVWKIKQSTVMYMFMYNMNQFSFIKNFMLTNNTYSYCLSVDSQTIGYSCGINCAISSSRRFLFFFLLNISTVFIFVILSRGKMLTMKNQFLWEEQFTVRDLHACVYLNILFYDFIIWFCLTFNKYIVSLVWVSHINQAS